MSWMDNIGPPKPRTGDVYVPTGNPPGNPQIRAGINPGALSSFKPGHDPNRSPGHKVKNENRSIRRALIRLMNEPTEKQSKPRSKADEVAHKLYSLTKSEDSRAALIAIKELTDRIDGKAAPSVEEADAIKQAGAKVVLIDARMLPPVTSQQPLQPLLAEAIDEEPLDADLDID